MRRMTMIGIGLILAGILLCVGLSGGSFARMLSKDPASTNEGIVTSSGGVIELDKGVHQIWYKGDVIGPILVRGPGNVTYTHNEPSDSENYDEIYLWGDFEVNLPGEYRFEFGGSGGKLYVTKDLGLSTFYSLIYLGFVLGSIMVIAGIVLVVIGVIRQKRMDKSSFFQEASAPPGPVQEQGTIDQGADRP